MKIYFDTEFIEDGKTIDLVSIGLVRDDGAELYCVSSEFDYSAASQWVRDNVLERLHNEGYVKPMPRSRIAQAVHAFVGAEPEFWAYFADYDWVSLCQLYGTMMDLPSGWPMFCRDLKQSMEGKVGFLPTPSNSAREHNALYDARWVRLNHSRLMEFKSW